MTLAELKTKADAKLVTFWNLLKTKQEAYLIKHGDYFQLLPSPTDIVVDGADSQFTLTHPSDQIYQADVDFPWSDTIPFQIQVDVFGGMTEHGYEATVTVQLPNGNIYKRSRKLIDPRIRNYNYDTTNPGYPIPIGDAFYTGTTSEVDSGWYQYTLYNPT